MDMFEELLKDILGKSERIKENTHSIMVGYKDGAEREAKMMDKSDNAMKDSMAQICAAAHCIADEIDCDFDRLFEKLVRVVANETVNYLNKLLNEVIVGGEVE